MEVALPDAAQPVNWLCQPVRGDDAQPGARVEEEQEVNGLWRHRKVAQDEVECAVQGGVEGLAGVAGGDVVGPSPLELSVRHEQGGGGIGAGEGPLVPIADPAVSREHLRDALDEGAREQLCVRLAQGYGPVVVQPGGARYLGAEPDVRISPVHQRRGAAEDGPVRVDEEPLDRRREGLDEAGFYGVGPRGLAIGLVQCEPQVLHGVLLDLGPRFLRDAGHVAAKDGLEAGKVHWTLVVQFPPEGANREHHVVGLYEERLRVGDPQIPEARRAQGLHLDGPSHSLPTMGNVLGVAAPEVFDGALAVGRQECGQLADVLLEGGCLPLQFLL